MSMKMKAMVTAVALAMGTHAQAAIDIDDGLNPGTGTGAGELFLSVVDRGASTPMSYVLDLGITAANFLANDASYLNTLSFAADSNLQTLLANPGGTVAWNLTAIHNSYGANFDDLGYLTSAPTAPTAASVQSGWAGMSDANAKAAVYAGEVNTALGANASVLITSSSSNAFHDGGLWGDTWHASSHSTEGGLGDSLGFYFVASNFSVDGDGSSSRVVPFLGQWTLAANGTLSYGGLSTPPPAAVPVPAAVWLLGSALVGLVGVSRRRQTEVQA